MRALFRPRFIFPLLALVLITSMQGIRMRRVQQLTALPEWSVDAPTPQPSSTTGYSDGRRAVVVPDLLGQSQQWIAQTQQMLNQGVWRIQQVDYDNAPYGRETKLPGIYRIWLVLLALFHRIVMSTSSGLAVEQVALYADPLLQILLAVATARYVRRHFGSPAALLVVVAFLTIYPAATGFIPGAPNPQGLMEASVFWSVMPIAAALWPPLKNNSPKKSKISFFAAGAAGGVGLWLNLNTELSVIVGIMAGAIGCTLINSRQDEQSPPPWRLWAMGGCLVSLAGYMVDNFPTRLTLTLDVNHPVYALAWLGAGELLHRLNEWSCSPSNRPRLASLVATGIALLAVGAVGFIWISHRTAIFASDIAASQLTRLGGGLTLSSFAQFISNEGLSVRVCALLLPVLLVTALGIPLLARNTPLARRSAFFFTLGPVVVTLLFAFCLPRWWNTVDSVALVALAVAAASTPSFTSSARIRWTAGIGVGAIAWLGLIELIPSGASFHHDEFTPVEIQKIVERDLAHWLAQRHPGAVVLAPANLTTSLWFHGGLRGITTFDVDNNAGLEGALRISAALTQQEASLLIQNREVSYIVLPSWDLSLDQSARVAAEGGKSLFIEQLRHWIFPLWIRPIAYFSPPIDGFESKSVLVLEVVEPQGEPTVISQLATYFIEANLPDHAADLRKAVSRFPTNMSALITRAEIEYARDDHPAFAQALTSVAAALEKKADRALAWDRRVALAAVLAEGNRDELARTQISRCFAEVDEARLRFLSPRSLFHFLAVGKNYGLTVADPSLRQLALQLLPPDSRARAQ